MKFASHVIIGFLLATSSLLGVDANSVWKTEKWALKKAGTNLSSPLSERVSGADDVGLLGPQVIASNYSKAGTPVLIIHPFTASSLGPPSKLAVADDKTCGYACRYQMASPPPRSMRLSPETTTPRSTHLAISTTSVNGFSWGRTYSLGFAKIALAFLYEPSA